MKKNKNLFNEDIFTFETKSGLKTTIIHRPGFKRSFAVIATPFGALDLVQIVDGEKVEHKSGVAHFLEHKLFEDDTKDVLSQFADMGASGNAFTSYDQTMYYFSHNGRIEEPLRLLLQFVGKISISEESVEKEKGIIIEEINMYDQMPEMKLLNETYKNIYHKFPFIYDIAGTIDSVSETTRNDLETAYKINYADSQMELVVITPESPEFIENIVCEETSERNRASEVVMTYFEPEPEFPKIASREISGDVVIPKMTLSFKKSYKGTNRFKDEFLIKMLLEINFSELNSKYQTWLDEDVFSESFGFDVDIRNGLVVIYFINEGLKPQEFETLVLELMNNLEYDELSFVQLSNRYYGEMISQLDKPDELAISMMRAQLDGIDYFEYLNIIKELTYNDLISSVSLVEDLKSSFLIMNGQVEQN